MPNFSDDLEAGKGAEDWVLRWCLIRDEGSIPAPVGSKGYDIILPTLKRSFEVKFDRYSKKSGNVAIEYSYMGNPSGIHVTRADLWAIKMWNDGDFQFWRFKSKTLLELCNNYPTTAGGDYGASLMHLIPVVEIIPHGRQMFLPS